MKLIVYYSLEYTHSEELVTLLIPIRDIVDLYLYTIVWSQLNKHSTDVQKASRNVMVLLSSMNKKNCIPNPNQLCKLPLP